MFIWFSLLSRHLHGCLASGLYSARALTYLFFIMSCLLTRESPMIIALNKEKTVYDGFITITLLVRKFPITVHSHAKEDSVGCQLRLQCGSVMCELYRLPVKRLSQVSHFSLFFNLWQEKDFRIRISLPPDQQMKRAKYDWNSMSLIVVFLVMSIECYFCVYCICLFY